jgi:hypothetical protein
MNNIVDVVFITFVQRAGNFIEQQDLGQKLQITDQRNPLFFATESSLIDFSSVFSARPKRCKSATSALGSGC